MIIIQITALAETISTIGFPIVAYLLMFKLARDTIQENTKALERQGKALDDLQDEIRELRGLTTHSYNGDRNQQENEA